MDVFHNVHRTYSFTYNQWPMVIEMTGHGSYCHLSLSADFFTNSLKHYLNGLCIDTSV